MLESKLNDSEDTLKRTASRKEIVTIAKLTHVLFVVDLVQRYVRVTYIEDNVPDNVRSDFWDILEKI